MMLATSSLNTHADDVLSGTSHTGIDNLNFQLYGGINKSANENLPMSEFSSYPWSGGVFLGIGQEFNALWGWRTTLRYNYNKSRNVQQCETPDTWGWQSLGLFADATFDITDALISPKRRGARLNVKAFAGVGASYAFGYPKDIPLSYSASYSTESKVVPAARAGFDITYRLNDKWKLGMELSHTIFADRFNGVKTGSPLDMRSNMKIGVTYVLGKKAPKLKRTGTKIIYDTRLHAVPTLPFRIPNSEETKLRIVEGRAFLDFPINETFIDSKYRRNPEELKRLRKTIEHALFDKSIRVQRVTFHGYASPESPYSNNTRLAKGRTQSLKQYVCKRYGIRESVVETAYTPEDWVNLRTFIDTRGESRRTKDNIWYEHQSIVETPEMPQYVIDHRDELLRVIDLNMDLDEKEQLLKQVGGGEPYRWLLQYVYPGLRHTDYTIEYEVKHYPVKEARRLIYTHPEALSIEEMYRVAQNYGEGTDGWLDALLMAARHYPESSTANLNAASACLRMRRLTDAKHYLRLAGDTEDSAYLSNVIRAMEGTPKWRIENNKLIMVEN